MAAFQRRSKNCVYPIQKLGHSLALVQYGISERAVQEPVGVPMLRMINLQDNSWDLSDIKYIEMSEKEKRPYLLKQGDILFNRTNSKELVGKCNVFDLPGEYVFASYLIRVRTRAEGLHPSYVTAFLSSGLGRIQIDAVSRQIAGMTNINAEEIRELLIPSPPGAVQEQVVSAWQAAIKRRDQTFERARQLLTTIDDVLLDKLGIPRRPEPPDTIEGRIFRRAFSEVSGGRFDPAANWKQFSFASRKHGLRRLRDLVLINPSTRFPRLDRTTPVSFVPMDAVSDVFGEIADRQTRPIGESGSYTRFQDGDVIWAKITPCMENGKAALAQALEQGCGFGSTEFHVFRPRNRALSPLFLHHLLRHRLVREHARLHFTGSSGHQRVDEQFFDRMEIPLPSRKEQDRIAATAEATKDTARALMKQAAGDLERAKQEIEAVILGKEPLE